MNITALMGRFKVHTRIYAGFLLVLGLLAALAGSAYFGLTGTRDIIADYVRISHQADQVQQIERDVASLRRDVLLFASSGDQRAIDRIHRLEDSLRRDLTAVRDSFHLEQRRETARRMLALVEQYAGHLMTVIERRALRERLVEGQMTPLGETTRRDLAQVIQTAMADGDFEAAAIGGLAQQEMMVARLDAVRFLASPNAQLVDAARRQFVTMEEAVGRLAGRVRNPERQRLANEVRQSAQQYQRAFLDVAEATLNYDMTG